MPFLIPRDEAPAAFAECWHSAASHVDQKLKREEKPWASGPFFCWYKIELRPPFLEHFSFRLGNQLFFVRVEDVEGRLSPPGSRDGLNRVAIGQSGHACIMPMRQQASRWVPAASGWGLIDAKTGNEIDPPGYVTNEQIEMTGWEVHDFAVDVVCNNLKSQNIEIIDHQGDPEIYQSIWFSNSGVPSWVLIKAFRYPHDGRSEPLPSNWLDTCWAAAHMALKMAPEFAAARGTRGYFAPVSIARADDPLKVRQNHCYEVMACLVIFRVWKIAKTIL